MTSMSVKGPFLGDISIRIPLKKPSLVILLLADSFVEEHNGLGAIYFPFSVPCSSQNTSNSLFPPNSDEKEHACDASLSPSSKVSQYSSIVSIKVMTAMGIANRYASTYKDDDNNSAYENSKFVTRMDITKLKIMTNSTSVLTISVHVHVDQCREDHSMKFKQENIGFMKQFEDEGIEHQLTLGYTPQQNGVSQWKNRTVMEMARFILMEKNLPKKFWAKAVRTTIYLLNRLLTKAVQDKTPVETWFGRKPSTKHLRVFGSICYAHIPAQKRSKLDAKAERGIFLGYDSQAKGYRIFNLDTEKIMISKDVEFNEDASWNWDEEKTPPLTPIQPNDDSGDSNNSQNATGPRGKKSLLNLYNECPILHLDLEECERCYLGVEEPQTYEQAFEDKRWQQAMENEMSMIKKNQTWELVDRPNDRKVIGVKWVYKIKLNHDGSISMYKARLVVKGYSQQAAIDYGDTFAPITRLDNVKTLIALAAEEQWKIYQLDVKSAFLNGELEEEIFIEQPLGFVVKGKEEKGFERSKDEHTLYVKNQGKNDLLIVSLYVDDLFVTRNNSNMVLSFKEEMKKKFEMSDLGLMNYFLGMKVHQGEDEIFISQRKCANDVLKKFKMQNCKPVSTPLVVNEKLSKFDGQRKVDSKEYKSLVGSLLYFTATRPYLMFATSFLSRFMNEPSDVHIGFCKKSAQIKKPRAYGLRPALPYQKPREECRLWKKAKAAEMSGAATAAYLTRRAAQKERVRILYRRALKDTLNWAVHRHLFYQDASDLREKFEANKNVGDLDTIDKMIAAGEATYDKWRHPDPYIVPWAPGGSKFTRNPVPPSGIEIVYDYGKEDND
ncbi:hypothetical protein GQ457_15G013260 [Hibiscus cannabinus]